MRPSSKVTTRSEHQSAQLHPMELHEDENEGPAIEHAKTKKHTVAPRLEFSELEAETASKANDAAAKDAASKDAVPGIMASVKDALSKAAVFSIRVAIVFQTLLAVLASAAVASLLLRSLAVLAAAAIVSLLIAGTGIATILFITRIVATPARLFPVAGCRMGRRGGGEGRSPVGSRTKGAHPHWFFGSFFSRRLSEHGNALGDFATARDAWGLGRLAQRIWSAASCALALVCSAIAACCAPARRARRSHRRGRACAERAMAANAGAKSLYSSARARGTQWLKRATQWLLMLAIGVVPVAAVDVSDVGEGMLGAAVKALAAFRQERERESVCVSRRLLVGGCVVLCVVVVLGFAWGLGFRAEEGPRTGAARGRRTGEHEAPGVHETVEAAVPGAAATVNEVAQRHAKICMDVSGLIRKGNFGGIALFDGTLDEQVRP